MGVQEVRARLVEQATKRLAPHLPRLQMFGMVLITALAGFLASFTLYRGLDVVHMGIRYPIAMLVAYGVFLFCVWRWVKYQRRKAGIEEAKSNKGHSGDWSFDLPRFGGTGSGSGGGDFRPGGGAFGGAGAGSSWSSAGTGITQAEAYSYVSPAANAPTSGGGWFGSGKSGGGFDLDLDDGVAILIVVLIVGAILAALTYVVWAAPSILGEVFVDGVLASTLARGVRDAQTGHWFWTVLRKTWWMLLLLLVILGWGGFALQEAFPQAHTLSEVLIILK